MLTDPNTITQLGIGGLFVLLTLKEIFKFLTAMRSKPTDKVFMTEKDHDTQCELASLRMEKHFKKHFDKLKNDVFAEFRKLDKAIEKMNNKNGDDDD